MAEITVTGQAFGSLSAPHTTNQLQAPRAWTRRVSPVVHELPLLTTQKSRSATPERRTVDGERTGPPDHRLLGATLGATEANESLRFRTDLNSRRERIRDHGLTRTAPDARTWNYGSEGWGFESLRARQATGHLRS
jgi:hypothetical protein